MRTSIWILLLCLSTAFSQGYFHKNGFEPLTDIGFADSLTGWACGQKGTLLYTVNGGETWTQANVPHPFFVEKLCFVSRTTGFAVGGIACTEAPDYPPDFNWPNTKHAMGAILHTMDGGKNWHQDSVESQYPELFHRPTAWLFDVDFVDSLHGFACGSFQSLYRTSDGGAHWRQLFYQGLDRYSETASGSWLYALDFIDTLTGYAAGEDSTLLKTTDGGATWTYLKGPVPLISSGNTPQDYTEGKRYNFFRSIKFQSASTGLALGDNGCLLKTGDSGKSWSRCALPYAPSFLDLADFKDGCWLNADTAFAVSHAGGELLRTIDGGAVWTRMPTGFSGWFNAVFFADARHGWMAGECGLILRTRDGGQTWAQQHGPVSKNGSLAPILVVHAHGDDEIIWGTGCLAAKYGLNENIPVVGIRLTKDTRYKNLYRQGEVKRLELRTADGVAGYSGHRTLDEFDTDGYTDYAAELVHWGGSDDVMMTQLVHAMRVWKPMVVVTHDSVYGEYGKQNHITGGRIAAEAWHASGDSSRFTDHFTSGGLSPWAPKKLYFFRLGAAPASAARFTLDWNEKVLGSDTTIRQQADRALLSYMSQEPAGLAGYVNQCSTFVRMECAVNAPFDEDDILAGTGYPVISAERPQSRAVPAPGLLCTPNPFRPDTRITFGLRNVSDVTLEVFDVRGRRVALLLEQAGMAAGLHSLSWNAEAVGSGLYTVRMKCRDGVRTYKAMRMR